MPQPSYPPDLADWCLSFNENLPKEIVAHFVDLPGPSQKNTFLEDVEKARRYLQKEGFAGRVKGDVLEVFERVRENVASELREIAQKPITPKKRERDMQERELDVTNEYLINLVTDASDIFGKVTFPSYYNKFKTIWKTRDSESKFYVLDLGDEDTWKQIYSVLNEDELDLLYKSYDIVPSQSEGDEAVDSYLVDENNNETIEKNSEMEKIVHQLDSVSEKYHYLSNFFLMPADYDQTKMPDLFIARYFSCEGNRSTKIDIQDNGYKADGILELFERPKQILLFLLEVSEGPNNPDPDKINEDRCKLLNEGVFGLNKLMLTNKIEIGQLIFIGPGLYLFAPFTIPALTIPTSDIDLNHVPRLIRTLLCLRYNLVENI
ncbi:46542_t:CDS:2 [Gigaspora margarita]|uniref:46542_t:CDS:1 n=1 Tax=Gigaspora margarita TaxID=4874 RepID=A0ABN7VPJ0_GIGMA|nr:46542_t:CDS:2 [Gigaspora margarita]